MVTGGVTTGGSYTDITERWMVKGRREWTILPTANLPNKMEGAAMVSIYNTLYLTGKNEYLHGHNFSQYFDINELFKYRRNRPLRNFFI